MILSCRVVWLRQYIKNCRVHNSYDFDSDHRLVIANIKTPCTKTARYVKRKHKAQTKRLDYSAFNNPDTLERFKNTVSENLNSVDLETDNSSLNENF